MNPRDHQPTPRAWLLGELEVLTNAVAELRAIHDRAFDNSEAVVAGDYHRQLDEFRSNPALRIEVTSNSISQLAEQFLDEDLYCETCSYLVDFDRRFADLLKTWMPTPNIAADSSSPASAPLPQSAERRRRYSSIVNELERNILPFLRSLASLVPDAGVWPVRSDCHHRRLLDSKRAPDREPSDIADQLSSRAQGKRGSAYRAKPRKLLVNWREITSALELKYAEREKVKSLNSRFNGPIKNQGPGTSPMVNRDDLIEWWNNLEIAAQESANVQSGAKASGATQHNYGRGATVAPEINGEVKGRRRRSGI